MRVLELICVGVLIKECAYVIYVDSFSIMSFSIFNELKERGGIVKPKYGGITLPGSNHIGPGNQIKDVPILSKADGVARVHDISYNKAISQQDVREADRRAIKSFWGTKSVQGKIGAVGLGLKYGAESIFGVKYPANLPSIAGNNVYH